MRLTVTREHRMSNRVPDLPILGEPLIAEFANTLYVDESTRLDVLDHPSWISAWLRQAPCAADLAHPARVRPEDAARLRALRDAIRGVLERRPASACGRHRRDQRRSAPRHESASAHLERVGSTRGRRRCRRAGHRRCPRGDRTPRDRCRRGRDVLPPSGVRPAGLQHVLLPRSSPSPLLQRAMRERRPPGAIQRPTITDVAAPHRCAALR